MEIGSLAGKSAALVTSLGVIGSGAIYLDNAHAPIERVVALESSGRVTTIQNWVRAAREDGPSQYICDAIEAELAALCTEQPNHYLCKPETIRDLKAKAGCQ